MILARIVGTVVATRKDARLVSNKLGDEHHSEKTAEACERGHAKTFTFRDAFPCVGDQSSHCGALLSKQRAACC